MKDHTKSPMSGQIVSVGNDFELRGYIRQLWRHRRLLFGTIIILMAVASTILFQITPLYRGEALVMIAPPKSNVVQIESVLSGLPFSENTLNSEIAILKSRKLATRVVEKLDLVKDPEFNTELRGDVDILDWIAKLLRTTDASALTPSQQKQRRFEKVVDAFSGALDVEPVHQSRVIRIRLSSRDAQKAAQVANTVADLYLVEQLEAKFEATQRATNWLSSRITELRDTVIRSESAVEEYRRENGLIKGKDDTTIAASQISELTNQIVAARAKRAEAEAQLSQIERLLKSRGGVESAGGVLSSALIQSLRERESTVIGKMAELGAEYGPKHPKMIAVRAELADLRRKIQDEVRKIVEGIRSEVRVAQAREESLELSLKRVEQRAAVLNEKSVRLRALEREATVNRTLLQTVLNRFKETSGQEGLQTPDARVISAAVVPIQPYFPNKTLFLGLAFAGSVVIALTLLVLLERLDSGFRSAEQVESLSGLPALGLVPEIGSKKQRGDLQRYLRDQPLSPYAESIRNLQVSLALADVDNPVKSIVVTAATPEEGKSTLAYSLAQTSARLGKMTVLVDCDLRRPVQHENAKLGRAPGLVELLAQQTSMDRVLRRDEDSGLYIICAGEPAPNPPNLLASQHMREIIKKLSDQFDLVILDTPPVMAVSDARILGGIADRAIVAVRWAKTRRESAVYTVKQLTDAGARVAGMVLTRVDIRKHADYGFADSGYFHKRYAQYYEG